MPGYSATAAPGVYPFSHFGHELNCEHAFAGAVAGIHRVPAVMLPQHPPKYWFGAFAYRPQLVQLQKLPSGSVLPVAHMRIGCPAGQSLPTDSDTKHEPVSDPLYFSGSSVQ